MNSERTSLSFSRRSFLALGGGAAAATLLAACTTGGSGSAGKPLKFWNMPWGGTTFNPLDKKITLAYKPAKGLSAATYQVIQWDAFIQTFASAVASNTGPAISSGGGIQAFQFAAQDKVAYADDLLDSWKKNGLYDDFLPGLTDIMKTKKGTVAVPYGLDIRVGWYNKTLLDRAGAAVPTDWQSYLDACKALKKNGIYGFGTGAGPGSNVAGQIMTSWMINNGGGIFDENQKPNLMTDANIQAIEFLVELARKGYTDPASTTYTSSNIYSQWDAHKFGMGFDIPGLAAGVNQSVRSEVAVHSPLTSPNGGKGTLLLPSNIMMYTNTPSQKDSEAFLTYYYKNMAPLWTEQTGIGLPPLKSITSTPAFRSDPNAVKIIEEWQPVGKTWAAPGSQVLFPNVATVDGTTIMSDFAQTVLAGKEDAKSILKTLQAGIESTTKSY